MNEALLYLEFVKIGFFSVGGGLATLPFLYNLASRSDILKPENIGNFLAIAQSSPGAIGVNISSQTGYLLNGLPGAIIAPLGLVCPAILVIIIVSRILATFKENKIVNAIFGGLRPAAAGLIFPAGSGVIAMSLYKEGIHWKETILFAVLFVLVLKFKKHPIVYIVLAGAAGVILGL